MDWQTHKKMSLPAVIVAGVALTVFGMMRGWFADLGRKENNLVQDEEQRMEPETVAQMRQHESRLLDYRDLVVLEQRGEEAYTSGAAAALEPIISEGRAAELDVHAPESTEEPRLVIEKTAIRDTVQGPIATIRFNSTETNLTGPLIIVAFLPPGSDARILDLRPTGQSTYSGIDKRISDNGWFAVFQGVPQLFEDCSFELSVSQPVDATIKGNYGIEPFEMRIRPK